MIFPCETIQDTGYGTKCTVAGVLYQYIEHSFPWSLWQLHLSVKKPSTFVDGFFMVRVSRFELEAS